MRGMQVFLDVKVSLGFSLQQHLLFETKKPMQPYCSQPLEQKSNYKDWWVQQSE